MISRTKTRSVFIKGMRHAPTITIFRHILHRERLPYKEEYDDENTGSFFIFDFTVEEREVNNALDIWGAMLGIDECGEPCEPTMGCAEMAEYLWG